MQPLPRRRRSRHAQAHGRAGSAIRTRRRSSPGEILRRARHRHHPTATRNRTSLLWARQHIRHTPKPVADAVIQRQHDRHPAHRHRHISSFALPQGGASRFSLSLLHAVKIPFYDLTFLQHHRSSKGSVLSSRSIDIGNFPTPSSHSHLRAMRHAPDGQPSTKGYRKPQLMPSKTRVP